jgi:hypothetical protein
MAAIRNASIVTPGKQVVARVPCSEPDNHQKDDEHQPFDGDRSPDRKAKYLEPNVAGEARMCHGADQREQQRDRRRYRRKPRYLVGRNRAQQGNNKRKTEKKR